MNTNIELLDITQTSKMLGVTVNTLYSWVNQKKIQHFKIGRLVKFNRSYLEEWINGQKVEAAEY